ncbi:hypothetical protein F5Y12DRAFT_7125 [Xylaria sp. FL1777]|nr:hypothetical protein F5Y12DRAFT_7125 [Xylaria sp. FL1777]
MMVFSSRSHSQGPEETQLKINLVPTSSDTSLSLSPIIICSPWNLDPIATYTGVNIIAMGSISQTVIPADKAIDELATSQKALVAHEKSWEEGKKKPDLHFEEPLNDIRSLITFMSLIHGGDEVGVADWIDKHKTHFFQGASNPSQTEMLTVASSVVTTKLSTQTTIMAKAIKTLDGITTSARIDQTHFISIRSSLITYKTQSESEERDDQKLVTDQEETVKRFQNHVDDAQTALDKANGKLKEAKAKEETMSQIETDVDSEFNDYDDLGSYGVQLGTQLGIHARVEELHQQVKVKQAALDSVEKQLQDAKGERDTAYTTLTSRRNVLSTVHAHVEAASKAIASCDASVTESGKMLAELQALHDPWKSLEDSAVNLTTWAQGLKKASGFTERLVLEVRVLRMLNQAVAMQDEPGVRDACEQILGDIVTRNQWAQQDVVSKTRAEESVLAPFTEIKDKLSLNGKEKKSLVPLLESKFPDSDTLIDLE